MYSNQVECDEIFLSSSFALCFAEHFQLDAAPGDRYESRESDTGVGLMLFFVLSSAVLKT